MKIFKSIKWRLQIWYGLILVGVLVGFGITAYRLARDQQFNRIDDELHQRIGVLINALHHPPPRGPRPEMDEGPDFNGPPPDGPNHYPDHDRPDFRNGHPLPVFHLPQTDDHYFDASDTHGFYFRISRVDRHGVALEEVEIARSTNCPSHLTPTLLHNGNPSWSANSLATPFPPFQPPPPKPPQMVSFDHFREISESLPSRESIVVGCSITPELNELKLTALKLSVVGGAILLLGLAGGWWLVDRALKPVAEISSAAARISGSDLAQRINVAEAESELGQLANVLNSTFGRLETAFEQQRQFTSDAAHELRTPVAVILTQTQTTLNRERDTASYRQALEACQRAAQRMRKLIESLLALARLDGGQEALNRRRFDLAEVVADSVTLLRPLAEEQRIKIFTELARVEINGDAERLGQVVTNLLANAIQYNQPDGEVRLRLKSENGLAVLSVVDTGPGISAADKARVFERFYRADSSRTGAANAGLGLAICQAIVTAHAGTIEVTSEQKIGTTFTVRLPVGN
jgi:heavy metal sensor kinase